MGLICTAVFVYRMCLCVLGGVERDDEDASSLDDSWFCVLFCCCEYTCFFNLDMT